MIVEDPGGVRPRDTFSPVALAVVIAIGVFLLLFIVFFIAALIVGTYRSRRQGQRAITSRLHVMFIMHACDLTILPSPFSRPLSPPPLSPPQP